MGITRRNGRGRLSVMDMLPGVCSEAIAWANTELGANARTQKDIYHEFCEKLAYIRRTEKLEFDTPSTSSFNRFSTRQAVFYRRLEEVREIAATISGKIDPETSDDLTLVTAEAIKSLIFELTEPGREDGITPKNAQELANALRAATAAQSVSSDRRRKVQAEFEAKAEKAIETVAKIKGLSKDTVATIRAEILGVKT